MLKGPIAVLGTLIASLRRWWEARKWLSFLHGWDSMPIPRGEAPFTGIITGHSLHTHNQPILFKFNFIAKHWHLRPCLNTSHPAYLCVTPGGQHPTCCLTSAAPPPPSPHPHDPTLLSLTYSRPQWPKQASVVSHLDSHPTLLLSLTHSCLQQSKQA